MRNVSINKKRYKLPASIKVPTTTPFPDKRTIRNTPGKKARRPSVFMPIPDQSPKEKAILAVPSSKVEEKIVTDYTKQAKETDKRHLDGLNLDKDIIFETLKKLKAKEKKEKKAKKVPTGTKKEKPRKKNKSSTTQPFAISS